MFNINSGLGVRVRIAPEKRYDKLFRL